MGTIKDIESFYTSNHKNKIFCTRLHVDGKAFDILYDYDKQYEVQKFVENFTEYLPYYAYCEEQLEYVDTAGDISKELSRLSKDIWNGAIIPKRKTAQNGIYGEVFLDFYERIVKGAKTAITHTSKREYGSNRESKGFDSVLFDINQNGVGLVLAEAKFVASKNKASDDLVKDIVGEPSQGQNVARPGHISKEFINRYLAFVVEKNIHLSEADKKTFKHFVDNLNDVLMNKNRDFVSFLVDNKIHITCVFFAIFRNMKQDPNYYITEYDKIEKEAKTNLASIGFSNYDIEIVFIPTNAESMKIKKAIDDFYA